MVMNSSKVLLATCITNSMMRLKMIKLRFDLEPVAQARPRATRMGRGIRLYDPRPTAVFKKTLRAMASEQYKGEPLEGQLFVKIRVYRAVQKSISKIERELRLSH